MVVFIPSSERNEKRRDLLKFPAINRSKHCVEHLKRKSRDTSPFHRNGYGASPALAM
jgi:hypothetical protein